MSDPTEVRINLNARVTVRLTEAGRQMHVDYYRKLRLGDLCDSIPAAGEPYQTMLWDLMHVLGPGMRMGAHPMIEGMTFTAPVGECVEVVRGEPAPDAPGLDLAPILARADAATPGPWEADLDVFGHDDDAEIEACVSAHNPETLMLFTSGTGLIHHGTDAERDAAWNLAMSGQQARDATFIANARTDIPALVSEVTRLRTALEHAITTGCAAVADALREGEEARAEVSASRDHVIALEQQNVALLRWQSVASDAHVDHLCAIVRSLAVSDEAPRTLRDLSAMGVEEEIRRAVAAERINREKSEAAVKALRKERDDACADLATVQSRYTQAWEALCEIGEALEAAGHPQLLPERALRVGEGVAKVIGERGEARARVKALESAPTFADGVRAGLAAALEVVYTATGAADNRLRANGGRVGADVCDELRVVAGNIEEIDPSTVKPSEG